MENQKTLSEKMREIAFKNKIVKDLYKEAIEEIKQWANDGDLHCEVGNDETVIELLLIDGFKIEKTSNDAYIKVKW